MPCQKEPSARMVFRCIFLGEKAIIKYITKKAQGSFFPLKSYSKKTLRKNVPKSARKHKRNAPWASYNITYIELIQHGRRIGKKVYWNARDHLRHLNLI